MNSILGNNPIQNNTPVTNEMIQQFQQFKSNFKGDPKQQVLNLMAQGAMSNQQFQQAMQIANQLKGYFK